ncbi:hypothetical protein K488DRAFT_70748, partial [Vararia minispora EC-137]
PSSNRHYEPRIRQSLDSVQERPLGNGPDAEIDIARFPAWSRHWYAAPPEQDKKSRTSFPQPPDRAAIFDLGYAGDAHLHGTGESFDPYFGSTTGDSSNRDLLPWSHRDSPAYNEVIDEGTKEERLRMLEREFGPNAPGNAPAAPDHVVGSVDERGILVTEGSPYAPSRSSLRSPSPSQRPTLSSCVTPFMRLLQVQALPGGKPQKGRRGRKADQRSVQVNLIVDPSAFMLGRLREDGEPDDGNGSTEILSGSGGVFEGLAMERAWREARRERKWMLVFDIASLVLWAADYPLILRQ